MKRVAYLVALATVVGIPLAAVALTVPAQAASHAAAPAGEKVVKSKKVGGSMVTLSTKTGTLTAGDNAITVSVTDKAGKPKAATVKKVNIYMPPMGSMAAMKADARLQPAKTPGVYTGTLDVEMKGPWKLTITFKDEKGPRRASFNVVAK